MLNLSSWQPLSQSTYAAPQIRNFGTPPKPATPKKAKPVYHTLPPIYNGKIAVDVYDHAIETLVTLTQCEPLLLLLEVWSQVHEATLAK